MKSLSTAVHRHFSRAKMLPHSSLLKLKDFLSESVDAFRIVFSWDRNGGPWRGPGVPSRNTRRVAVWVVGVFVLAASFLAHWTLNGIRSRADEIRRHACQQRIAPDSAINEIRRRACQQQSAADSATTERRKQ